MNLSRPVQAIEANHLVKPTGGLRLSAGWPCGHIALHLAIVHETIIQILGLS